MWSLPEDLRLLYPKLSQTEVNAVLIQGGKDFLVDPMTADYMRDKFPQEKLQVIYKEDMDHFLIWNDLESITKALDLLE